MDENQLLEDLLNSNYAKLKNVPHGEKCSLFAKAGDRALGIGWIKKAEKMYALAGTEISAEKIINCGDICLRKSQQNLSRQIYWLKQAIESYTLAGCEEGLAEAQCQFDNYYDCYNIEKPKNNKMTIPIASDHAGFDLKKEVISYLRQKDRDLIDFGPYGKYTVDFPDFAALVAKPVSAWQYERGILICGSGQGMCVTANKFPGIRAVVCDSEEWTKVSREHLDSNILCLGARRTTPEKDMDLVRKIIDIWLGTNLLHPDGDRYAKRINRIEELSK